MQSRLVHSTEAVKRSAAAMNARDASQLIARLGEATSSAQGGRNRLRCAYCPKPPPVFKCVECERFVCDACHSHSNDMCMRCMYGDGYRAALPNIACRGATEDDESKRPSPPGAAATTTAETRCLRTTANINNHDSSSISRNNNSGNNSN